MQMEKYFQRTIWITVECILQEFSICYNKSKIHDNSVRNIESTRVFRENGEQMTKDCMNHHNSYNSYEFERTLQKGKRFSNNQIMSRWLETWKTYAMQNKDNW